MTEVGGIDLLLGWGLFALLLGVLAYLVLRHPTDARREARRRTDDPPV